MKDIHIDPDYNDYGHTQTPPIVGDYCYTSVMSWGGRKLIGKIIELIDISKAEWQLRVKFSNGETKQMSWTYDSFWCRVPRLKGMVEVGE